MTRLILLAVMLLAACQPAPSTSDNAQPSPSTSPHAPETTASKVVHAQGVLVAIRASKHADHDSVEFEFGGAQPPVERHEYEAEVRSDPADQLVTLQGKAFLRVVFHAAALDNYVYESDPREQEKYPGPTRIAPGLPVLKELAAAGSFEGVLSFGLGLDRQVRVTTDSHRNPTILTVNLWYS